MVVVHIIISVYLLRDHNLAAYVSPVRNGCVVVAEERADTQATAPIVSLAKLLSIEARAPVLAVLNHDDDALALGLYVSGQEVTDYSSDPDFICQDTGTKLCAEFDASHAVAVVPAQTMTCEKLCATPHPHHLIERQSSKITPPGLKAAR